MHVSGNEGKVPSERLNLPTCLTPSPLDPASGFLGYCWRCKYSQTCTARVLPTSEGEMAAIVVSVPQYEDGHPRLSSLLHTR